MDNSLRHDIKLMTYMIHAYNKRVQNMSIMKYECCNDVQQYNKGESAC